MIVYIWGNLTADNFTPRPDKDTIGRPGQQPGLSASEAIPGGRKAQGIDIDRLEPPLKAIPDDTKLGGTPGHFALAPVDENGEVNVEELEAWALAPARAKRTSSLRYCSMPLSKRMRREGRNDPRCTNERFRRSRGLVLARTPIWTCGPRYTSRCKRNSDDLKAKFANECLEFKWREAGQRGSGSSSRTGGFLSPIVGLDPVVSGITFTPAQRGVTVRPTSAASKQATAFRRSSARP